MIVRDTRRAPGRVATGAEWLDAVHPGWERLINLETFNIGNACNCVIGQVLEAKNDEPWSQFVGVVRAGFQRDLALGQQWLNDHGFAFSDDTGAWVELIKERFDSGVLSDS